MGIISSIIKLSDRKILVVESSYKKGHLFVFNNVGKFIREMKIKGGPWDVTQLDEGTIAVTYPEENSLKFINLVTDQVIDTIPLNTSGWGLGSDSDAIYVGLKGNELRALDYYGNKIGSVTIKSRLENFHITPDKIYYADPKKHALICDLNDPMQCFVIRKIQYFWSAIGMENSLPHTKLVIAKPEHFNLFVVRNQNT